MIVIKTEKQPEKKESAINKSAGEQTWRKEVQAGGGLLFVLGSGPVRTILPKGAIPGMELGQSKGDSFRAAGGEVILRLGDHAHGERYA